MKNNDEQNDDEVKKLIEKISTWAFVLLVIATVVYVAIYIVKLSELS